MKTDWQPLLSVIDQSVTELHDEPVEALVTEIRNRYGDVIVAILFYGSCMRNREYFDGLLDLYVIVDSYHAAYKKLLLASINKMLPPNVFNIEIPFADKKIKAKYAVLSTKDFQKASSRKWFHSYIWSRFTQPIKIVYLRDSDSKDKVTNALANASHTFLYHVIPMLPNEFDSETLWNKGFKFTYQSELRAEKVNAVTSLYESNPQYFDLVLKNAINTLPYQVEIKKDASGMHYQTTIGNAKRLCSSILWKIRAFQGKMLSIFRLLKALFTFDQGVEYIVSKLEKHSGQNVELSDKVKRHPLIYGWGYFLKLYKRKIYK